MMERLTRLGSWGRKALVLGALIGAPVLAAAPAAEAQTIQAVIGVATPAPEAVPVQWMPPPHARPRHWHRPPPPPPRHWRRHHARRYSPPPPPPPRYHRHPRPYYYR